MMRHRSRLATSIHRAILLPLLGLALVGCGQFPQLPSSYPSSFQPSFQPQTIQHSGVAALNHGEYDNAIRSYSETIAAPNISDSLKAEAYNYRCIAYIGKGMRDEALADCNDAIKLKPDFNSAYANRAMIYIIGAQFDLAIADLDVAIGLKPDSPSVLSDRGLAYYRKNKLDEAIADFNEAIRLKPDLAIAYHLRGATYFAKGDPGRTIADETDAIRLNPRDAEARDLRALGHLTQQEADAAFTDINAAVQLQPNASGLYADRGIIELAMARFPAAADDFEHALKIRPMDANMTMWLHVARSKVGTADMAEFERNAAGVDQTKWPGPIISLYRGQIQAIRLDDMAPSGTGSALAVRCMIEFHIGEYNLLQHDAAGAKTFLEKAKEICPSYLPEGVLTQVELKRIGE